MEISKTPLNMYSESAHVRLFRYKQIPCRSSTSTFLFLCLRSHEARRIPELHRTYHGITPCVDVTTLVKLTILKVTL